ncbi:MAG TPA: hypothetical protein VJ890_21635 [Vineibacter sp.]|nr:hypothetical protein [Vineibacter sp.]
MTPNRFRVLLTVNAVLFAAGMLVDDIVPPGFSEALLAAYGDRFYWFDNHYWPSVVMFGLLIGIIVASYVGLYLFKRWGRSVALLASLASIATYLVYGVTLTSGLQGALLEAGTLLFGANIALAYYSQVSERFDSQ